MTSGGMDFEDGEDEIDSGTLLFQRIVEAIGDTCDETGDLTKYQIIGCLECVKMSIIDGLKQEPETGIDLDGKPEDN